MKKILIWAVAISMTGMTALAQTNPAADKKEPSAKPAMHREHKKSHATGAEKTNMKKPGKMEKHDGGQHKAESKPGHSENHK